MSFERDPQKLYPHDLIMRYTIIPLIPKWITPNMVTSFRFFGIPFVLYFLYLHQYAIGVPLFFFFAFTDAIDGSLARLRKQITRWGSFYDPIADKLLISSVVLLVVMQHVNPWFGLLIIFIEVLIAIGGWNLHRKGQKVQANIFGKTKMCLQVLGVLFLLIAVWSGADLFIPVSIATLSLAIAFAIASLFTYGI